MLCFGSCPSPHRRLQQHDPCLSSSSATKYQQHKLTACVDLLHNHDNMILFSRDVILLLVLSSISWPTWPVTITTIYNRQMDIQGVCGSLEITTIHQKTIIISYYCLQTWAVAVHYWVNWPDTGDPQQPLSSCPIESYNKNNNTSETIRAKKREDINSDPSHNSRDHNLVIWLLWEIEFHVKVKLDHSQLNRQDNYFNYSRQHGRI